MKKMFLKLNLFALQFMIVFSVIVSLLGVFVHQNTYTGNLIQWRPGSGHQFTRFNEAEKTTDVDILILGSSHASVGFDTRVFEASGFKTMNLGSSAQRPIQSEYILNRFVDRMNPKLVIFEVYPAMFSHFGVESVIDMLSHTTIDKELAWLALRSKNIKVYVTFLYRYLSQTLGFDQHAPERRQTKRQSYIPGGFVENTNPPKFKDKDLDKVKDWRLEERQKLALERVINRLAKKHINVLLVRAPITQKLYSAYRNNDEVNQYFSKLGPFVDMNSYDGLDNIDLYYDLSHLKQEGVEKMNHLLLEYIKKNVNLNAGQ